MNNAANDNSIPSLSSLALGQIVYAIWGYGMTLAVFAKVVKITPKGYVLQPIGHDKSYGAMKTSNGWESDTREEFATPIPEMHEGATVRATLKGEYLIGGGQSKGERNSWQVYTKPVRICTYD